MTKNFKMSLAVALVLAFAAVVVPSSVRASGSVPSGTVAAGAKARVNNAVSMGMPLDKAAKGSKVFGIDTAATLVVDEQGVAPTAGGLATIEIAASGAGIGAALPVCYALVYDSSVASDTTESNSVSRLLVPPLPAALSQLARVEFAYPRQFNKGMVVLLGGAGAASCRASISWVTNGGAE
jgi:hypothetical protein